MEAHSQWEKHFRHWSLHTIHEKSNLPSTLGAQRERSIPLRKKYRDSPKEEMIPQLDTEKRAGVD